MLKLKKVITVALVALVANVAVAKGVMMEMFQMKKQLNTLVVAEDTATFQTAAEQFIEVAEKAKTTMPASLDDDKEMFKGYQAGMQEVIDVVKNANELAKQGKLDEAKNAITQLNKMKAHYHQQYK